ncbi:MAG: phospholipase [Acidobacteria bacterium]|nr:MAG: phospholipase [Acidobacteriota bacterium]
MGDERRQEREIAALVHGRYLLEIPPEPEGRPLVVGFHGYGENAEKSLDELRRLPGASRWVLCAVQALHPFYNRTGDVIASWMTRQLRERAVVDNIRYASSVVTEIKRELPISERLVYLGFSQGAAMAYRAAAGSGHACQGVIVLGGDVPPELADRKLDGFPPVLLGRGASEEWYDAAKMEHDVELLRGKGVDVRPCVFQGGHEWTDEFRAAAGRFLDEVFQEPS